MTTARELIRRHRTLSLTEARLDDVEAALMQAEQDKAVLRVTIAELDPRRVTEELKTALRSPHSSSTHVTTLRRRHEMVHALLNQLEALDERIETTVADVETLAARTAQTVIGIAGDDESDVEVHLRELNVDITTLAAAHGELDRLVPEVGLGSGPDPQGEPS